MAATVNGLAVSLKVELERIVLPPVLHFIIRRKETRDYPIIHFSCMCFDFKSFLESTHMIHPHGVAFME
jgi:hypothetical protein